MVVELLVYTDTSGHKFWMHQLNVFSMWNANGRKAKLPEQNTLREVGHFESYFLNIKSVVTMDMVLCYYYVTNMNFG